MKKYINWMLMVERHVHEHDINTYRFLYGRWLWAFTVFFRFCSLYFSFSALLSLLSFLRRVKMSSMMYKNPCLNGILHHPFDLHTFFHVHVHPHVIFRWWCATAVKPLMPIMPIRNAPIAAIPAITTATKAILVYMNFLFFLSANIFVPIIRFRDCEWTNKKIIWMWLWEIFVHQKKNTSVYK